MFSSLSFLPILCQFFFHFTAILFRDTARKMDNTQSHPLYIYFCVERPEGRYTREYCAEFFFLFFFLFETHFLFSITIQGNARYNKMYVLVHRFLFCTRHFARFVTLTTNFCLEHEVNGEEHLVFGAVFNYMFLWNLNHILIRVQLKSVFQFFFSFNFPHSPRPCLSSIFLSLTLWRPFLFSVGFDFSIRSLMLRHCIVEVEFNVGQPFHQAFSNHEPSLNWSHFTKIYYTIAGIRSRNEFFL